ncbi:MAG: hypothetical protein KGH61_01575 [Candidatus Micrarchaeota archaeon]|nr:hypothetical protein [Candidatus Micrarchaeota archaeon]MDE1847621.1 hypothetical protein [Candidatus Micrarchaeota archaeon]MDE1863824.1 hypothetical protein [Candidatus Micrarchaeota archaeon]
MDSFTLKPQKPGPLSGITFVVKDNIAISGHISSFGSSKWRETHQKSRQHAPVIRKILGNGGRIVGLVKLDQMTFSLVGNIPEGTAPINPLYPYRFTGGSSSGTASAIAGKIAQVGIGTDTGGSIRVPAASCGQYAIRPSYGMIDTNGVVPLASSFDTVGIMSMNAELIKKTFLAVKADKKLAQVKVKRIILPIDILKTVSPEAAGAARKAAMLIAKALGWRIVNKKFDSFLNAQLSELYTRIQGREVWASHSKWATQNYASLFPEVQSRLKKAEEFAKSSFKVIEADKQARRKYPKRLSGYLGRDTIVILPIMYGLPPKRNASDNELLEFRKIALRLSSPAGLSGFPEAVMPIRLDQKRHTYGIGILGPKNSDLSLLESMIAISKINK